MTDKRTSKKLIVSPFRYPGGKSWLQPIISQWLAAPTRRIVEPFAGGGNVTLAALSQNQAKYATMVELDKRVAAVWQASLNGQSEWLARRIETFELSGRQVRAEIARKPRSVRQLAWVTLLHNRVSYGGVMTAGSGLLNEGENGNGLSSRWYPETLAERIRSVHKLRRRITFVKGNGLEVLERYERQWNNAEVAYFIDPPYVGAGRRLYTKNKINHRRLFEIAAKLRGRILMTYDDATEIRTLAAEFGFIIRSVEMSNRQHRKKTELLISKDFVWLKKE